MIFGTPSLITNGLILYLDATNLNSYTSGSSTWYDLSGNNNNFTMSGSLTHSYDSGFSAFTRTNRWYRDNFPSNLKTSQGGNGLTTIVWAKNNGATNKWQKLIGNGDEQNYIDLYAVISTGMYAREDGSSLFYNSGIPIANNMLFMGDSIWRMYISTNLNSGTLTNPTDAFGIGSEGDNAQDFPWNGNIMSVMLYSRVLSNNEMQQNYNAFKGRFGLS